MTNGAATTTITYVGASEELSSTAGVSTTTTSYSAGGKRIAQAVNGAFSYLGSDGLGSAEVALDGSGTAQASVLYDPYGNTRYASGTMPGSYGYTGQRADAATGLDYYGARYYDAAAGQFTSADTMQDGLNRYAYVKGNPETATDPTGHLFTCMDGCGSSGGGSGTPPPPPPPPTGGGCHSNCGGKKPGGKGPGSKVNVSAIALAVQSGDCNDVCQILQQILPALPTAGSTVGESWGNVGAFYIALVFDILMFGVGPAGIWALSAFASYASPTIAALWASLKPLVVTRGPWFLTALAGIVLAGAMLLGISQLTSGMSYTWAMFSAKASVAIVLAGALVLAVSVVSNQPEIAPYVVSGEAIAFGLYTAGLVWGTALCQSSSDCSH